MNTTNRPYTAGERRIPIYQILFCVLLGVITFFPAYSQYSDETFSLKQASEQYDERGFLKGQVINVDGKMAVSNVNGGVSYSYSLDKFTQKGYGFQVALNYCNSVSLSSFKEYYGGTAYHLGGSKQDYWDKFTRSHPLWIIGVNGFAVQTLSLVSDYMPPKKDTKRVWEYSEMPWLVEGYDFCNRMNRIEQVGQYDVISLLRADGSLLELRNPYKYGVDGNKPYNEFVTGHYFEDVINSTGWAEVEYDTTRLTSEMRTALYETMNLGLGLGDADYWKRQLYQYLPRRVHYFPGDGLEYVFVEHQIPFGWERYNGDGELTGAGTAGPTIFYLKEINDASGVVIDLRYSRHESPGDGSPGRALIKEIGEHIRFNYGNQFIAVEAHGRTTTLQLEKSIPLALFESNGGNFDSKESYIGAVKSLRDPEDRLTEFGYENYDRIFRGYKHPYSNSDLLNVTSSRLTTIKEPTARYAINYHEGTATEREIVYAPNPAATGALADWRLNNAARSVTKYNTKNQWLTTETYCFDGLSTSDPTLCNNRVIGFPQTVVKWKDRRTQKEKTTTYTFQQQTANRYRTESAPSPLALPLVYTALLGVSEEADGKVVLTRTSYATQSSGACILPVQTEQYVQKSSEQTAIRTRLVKTSYVTRAGHGYDGPAEVAGIYLLKVEKKTETMYNPKNDAEVLVSSVTEYLNLPYLATPQQIAQVRWDKFASLKKYDSLFKAGLIPCCWETMPGNYHVYDTLGVRPFTAPPFFGLAKESYRLDDQGRYLGGTKTVYEETSRAPGQNRRGLPLRDSLIAENRVASTLIAENRYGSQVSGNSNYGWTYTDERFPLWRRDGNGAVQEQSYRFASGGAIRVNDDGTMKQEELRERLLSVGIEKPMLERKLVRNARTGLVDTLQSRNEWTFFSLLSGQADFNGFYSRFEYDKNGRLSVAQLPKDFLGTQTTCTERFDGKKNYQSPVVWTQQNKEVITVRCPGDIFQSRTRTSLPQSGILTAGISYSNGPCPLPTFSTGILPTGGEPGSKRGQEEVLVTSGSWSIESYTREQRDVAICHFEVTGNDNLFAATQTLRGGAFLFFISSMRGRCFTMEVIVRRNSNKNIMAKRSYVMNCSSQGKREETLNSSENMDYLFSVAFTPEELQSFRQSGLAGFVVEIHVVTPGARIEIVSDGEDKRPHWQLDGVFNLPIEQKQFTMAYEYSKTTDSEVIQRVKTDDRFTAVNYPNSICSPMRYAEARHGLGADRLLEKSLFLIGNPVQPLRIDSMVTAYNGAGQARTASDQEGFVVQTEYDGRGRPVKVVNADSTYTLTTYEFGSSANSPASDQEFYGYYDGVITAVYDRQNMVQYTTAKYYDALGRMRLEETGTGIGLRTKYEYDRQNRLIMVINPAGDTTRYWYDAYGRIQYKYQPDMGYTSYAYDALGNVRFIQTQQQAVNGQLTFTEYDDMGRVTLVGETRLSGEAGGGGGGHGLTQQAGGKKESVLVLPPLSPRLTDQLDAKILRDGGVSASVTANKTVWLPASAPLPQFWALNQLTQTTCIPQPLTGQVAVPFLAHAVQNYNDPGLPLATRNDFEDIARYPQNARTVVQYDELPAVMGAVWLYFPNRTQWDALAPTGRVRNQKGRESAIAYRQHAGEPYHFIVMSYDERGRVEALLRYTENLGFDAVYYTYNSMNTITSVRVVDPLRQQSTWYGYDWNGRVDSVWTKLSAAGSGLGVTNPVYRPAETRPVQPDIVYSYSKRGAVNKMLYPGVATEVTYRYNARKALDTLIANKGGTLAFRQILTYNALGRITGQRSQHTGLNEVIADYTYDYQGQLANATEMRSGTFTTRAYNYDNIGNRMFNIVIGTQPERNAYTYNDPTGPNRLSGKRDSIYQNGVWTETGSTSFIYNANGAMTGRVLASGTTTISETFGYDNIQGVAKQYIRTQGALVEDWRYRASTSGDREQKRLYSTTQQPVKEWYYYLLGGDKKQLAVYKGIETQQTSCGQTFGSAPVYMFPTEYLVYGATDVHNITYRPVDQATSKKDYKVQDMLGSTRIVVEDNGQGGMITGRYDYEPFGQVVWSNAPKPRLAFIDREQDAESKLGSFGVRQYDDGTDRFNTIDPLWEKYPGLTPYHYAANSPLVAVDRGGDSIVVVTAGSALSASYYSIGYQGLAGHVAIGNTETGLIYSFEGDGMWKERNYQNYIENESHYRNVVEQTVNVDIDKVMNAIEESKVKGQQVYDTDKNSCVTQSILVLRAGGLPIKDPSTMKSGGAITPEILVSFLNAAGLVTNTKTTLSGTVSSVVGGMLYKSLSGLAWLKGSVRIESMYDSGAKRKKVMPGQAVDAP